MSEFFRSRPELRHIFFGGKGGVGKTVMAGATAVHLAGEGKRTLLASTNPVHSLSALEIDTRDAIDRSKQDIRQKIQWFLKFAEIKTQADEFVEAATMNPAFEESAMFENMVDLIFGEDYDLYVFDTAPTANARRLLGMSKVHSLWVNKMLKSREEAQSLRELLSITKKREQDPLMEYLVSFRERIGHARDLLTDEAKTSFFFVTLPEALPIAVIKRFVNWFTEFGIPVGGVVVNEVIETPDEGAPDFVRNRVAMQREYLDQIGRDFDGQVRAVLPLLDDEVRGVGRLRTLSHALFAS